MPQTDKIFEDEKNLSSVSNQPSLFEIDEEAVNIENSSFVMFQSSVSTKVKFHAQPKFMKIMEIAKVNFDEIIDSLDLKKNENQVFRAGEGCGMSGQFFFFSNDNKYIIKTVHESEKDLLLKTLDSFIDHFIRVNDESLIAKIFGLYTIYSKEFVPIHLILMENTIRVEDRSNKKVVFDMKGSIKGRHVKLSENILPKKDTTLEEDVK